MLALSTMFFGGLISVINGAKLRFVGIATSATISYRIAF